MKRSFIISGILLSFLLGVALITQGSGIVPAIVPALVPAANKTSTTSTVFALASSNALTASSAVCTNANGDMTTTACTTNAVTSVTPATANTNSTNDQQLMELSLSAGYLNSLGRPFEFYGAGVYTIASGTPTLEFKIKLCTVSGCGSGTVVTLVDITTTATVVLTANNWDIRVNGVTAATGAAGNLEVHGPVVVDLGSLITTADSTFGDTNSAVSSNIDLTAALFVDWTIKFSTNQASPNAMTQREGIVNPGGSTAGGGSGALTQISKQTLSMAAASITFSSIPATSTNLLIKLQARGDTGAANANVLMQFNGDTGADYDWQIMQVTAANAPVGANTNGDTSLVVGAMPAAGNTANFASDIRVDIDNYAGTTFQKTALSHQFLRSNNNPIVQTWTGGGEWVTTGSAITSIVLKPAAGNFVAGTTAVLYGEQ